MVLCNDEVERKVLFKSAWFEYILFCWLLARLDCLTAGVHVTKLFWMHDVYICIIHMYLCMYVEARIYHRFTP